MKDTLEAHTEAYPQPALPAARAHLSAAAAAVVIPPILFYAILFRNALNLPIIDDYDTVLGFLIHLNQLTSPTARVAYFFATQSGEFKLLLVQAVSWFQFYLCGSIDFRLLTAVGNGFVLLLGILLWNLFLPGRKNLARRLILFIPISWLIFQLQYCETLNFATPGLQHLAVLPLALGALYLLVRGERWAFLTALLCLILAVSADGNGMVVIPVGLLVLVRRRRYARIAVWLAVSASCIAAYAYRYDAMHPAAEAGHSIFYVILHFRPDYVIGFIGGAAGFPFHSGAACVALGSVLSAFYVWMAWRGYFQSNPAVGHCLLFLLITAVGVAGLRSDFGVANLPSRYTIYSALFLSFAWIAVVEEFLYDSHAPLRNNGVFQIAISVAILFSLFMDVYGAIYIVERRRGLVKAMAEFERATPGDPAASPIPPNVFIRSAADTEDFKQRARAKLLESMRLGIYRPPAL
jgi:hypothetical protein